MSLNFMDAGCQTHSSRKKFGLCDDPPPAINPAYIDEANGAKWIAVVINEYEYYCTFTAVDNCIDVRKPSGKPDKRCEGILSYNDTIIFVELKQRGALGPDWVKTAEEQIRVTIGHFERTDAAEDFTEKKAYIANSEHPKFKESQTDRMEKFAHETGYILRIENRIVLL
jgi:hypothetical protein